MGSHSWRKHTWWRKQKDQEFKTIFNYIGTSAQSEPPETSQEGGGKEREEEVDNSTPSSYPHTMPTHSRIVTLLHFPILELIFPVSKRNINTWRADNIFKEISMK